MTNLVAFSTADRKLLLSRQPRPALNCCLIELLAGQSLLQLFRLNFSSSEYPILSRPTDLKSAFVPVAQEDRLFLQLSISVTYPLATSRLSLKMLPTITQDSQLATAVANVIRPKLVEMGWSTDDGQESALIDYIVLMLVNGKTQEQLATELSNDFLGLDEGDTQALEFSRWLYGQVELLDQQINGSSAINSAPQHVLSANAQDFTPQGNGMDAEMGDAGDAM